MDMLLAFRGVHGGAANAARTAGIAAYFYDITVILVLIFLVIVFLAILGLCVELFRSWRTDPSERGRQSGRILLIILVVLSGMSYVDYNYTNLLGGLCKEAVKGPKVKGPRVNRGNVTNFGKHQVPNILRQYGDTIDSLQELYAELSAAKPIDIHNLQGRLDFIEANLITIRKGKPLPDEVDDFFKKLRKDINGKYTLEEVQKAQEAQLLARAAEQARWERADAYGPARDAIVAGREKRGGPFTEEEVDEIVRIQRAIGRDEVSIQWDIDAIREVGLLPEGYQIPPNAPPVNDRAARQAQKRYMALETVLLARSRRGTSFTKAEMDEIVRIQRDLGRDESFIQSNLNGYRKAGLLPEDYQMPPNAPPVVDQAAEKYRVLELALLERIRSGVPFTKEEVDDIVSIRRSLGEDEGGAQNYLNYLREKKLLPEDYQMPPNAPPETTPSARPSPDTQLPGGAKLTGDTIRRMGDAELGALVDEFKSRAAAPSPPALNAAETFAIMEQRHRFLKANNEEAAKELERTFRLPPRDAYTPANGRPNINGDNSREKIVITPEDLSKVPAHGAGGRSSANGGMTVPMPQERSIFPWLENVVDYGGPAIRDVSRAGWNGIYSWLQKNRPGWVMSELGGSPMPRNVIYRDGKPVATTTGSYISHTDDGIELMPLFRPGSPVPPKHPWLPEWGNPVWSAPEGYAAGQLVRGPRGRIGRVTDEGTVKSFSPVFVSIPKDVRNGEIVQFNNGATAQYVVPETGLPYLQPTVGPAKWIQNRKGGFTVDGSSTPVSANKSTIVYNLQAPDDPLANFFTYEIFPGKDGRAYALMSKDQAAALQQARVNSSRGVDESHTMQIVPPSMLRRLFIDPRVRVSMRGDGELGTGLSLAHMQAHGPRQSGLPEYWVSYDGETVPRQSRPILIDRPQNTPASPRVSTHQTSQPPAGGKTQASTTSSRVAAPMRTSGSVTSGPTSPLGRLLYELTQTVAYPTRATMGAPGNILRLMQGKPLDASHIGGIPRLTNIMASASPTPLSVAANTVAAATLGIPAVWEAGKSFVDAKKQWDNNNGWGALQEAGVGVGQVLDRPLQYIINGIASGDWNPWQELSWDKVGAQFAEKFQGGSGPAEGRGPVTDAGGGPSAPGAATSSANPAASTPAVDPTAGNPNISAQTPSSWVVPGALLGGLVGGAFGGLTARGETEEERRRNRAKGFALGGVGGTILGGLGGYAADQYQV